MTTFIQKKKHSR